VTLGHPENGSGVSVLNDNYHVLNNVYCQTKDTIAITCATEHTIVNFTTSRQDYWTATF